MTHDAHLRPPRSLPLALLLALAGCGDATDADADAAPPARAPDPPPQGDAADPDDDDVDARALTPCRIDADCDAGLHCALRVCTATCDDGENTCPEGQECSERGRCLAPGERFVHQLPARGEPLRLVAGSRQVTRAIGGASRAAITLVNDGEAPLRYRVETHDDAVTLDRAPRVIAPGAAVELEVTLDEALLAARPDARVIPIHVVTEVGSLQWNLGLAPALADGRYAGAVSFTGPAQDGAPADLGTSTLALALELHDDGTVTGQSLAGGSFWWPVDVTVTGTWTEDGALELELLDVIDAAALLDPDAPAGLNGVADPLARPVGRALRLSGAARPDGGFEGAAEERLTGLTDEAVVLVGSFALSYAGPQDGALDTPTDFGAQLPVSIPSWDYPATLEEGACDELGARYGAPETLALPGVAPACAACQDLDCDPDDALACGLVLAQSGFQLPAVLEGLEGGGLAQAPGDTWTWDDCMDQDAPLYDDSGTTCLDAQALRCADALLLLDHGSAQTAEEYAGARLRLAGLAHWRARAAAALADEALVDAAFAFKSDVSPGGTADRERQLLERALAELAGPLRSLHTPGYLRALHERSGEQHADDDYQWMTRALQLSTVAGELATRHARVAQRSGAAPISARAAAISLHARGALWAHLMRLHGAPDERGDLLVLGAQLRQLAALADEVGDDANAFGFAPNHVPLALGPADIEQGRGNFEAVVALAQDDIELFDTLAADAWVKVVEYETKSFQVASEAHQLEAQYDASLRELCGSDGTDAPDLERCGEHSGQLAQLRADIDAAALRVTHASQALENNVAAIATEELRFHKIVQNHDNLKKRIDDLQYDPMDGIFSAMWGFDGARSELRDSKAAADCAMIKLDAVNRRAVLEAECKHRRRKEISSGYSVFGWGVPSPSGLAAVNESCKAQRYELELATIRQCAALVTQTTYEDGLDALDTAEQKQLMVYSAEVDEAIRVSALNDQRASSEALVKNLIKDGLLLSIEIEQAEQTRTAAEARVDDTYREVASLLLARARALGQLVEQSPDNPLRNPAFLQARLEAGRRVLRLREAAIRRVYQALRALEYEINQPLPQLRAQLLAARSPLELHELMGCLDHVHEDYRLDWGYPQAYVTDISLREDIFAITDAIEDPVTGDLVSPAAQFQAVLTDPEYVTPDGVIALPFTVSPNEDWLFSRLLCDDRIESIDVKIVGDFLGDGELDVLVRRQGHGGVRRCDSGDMPLWSSVEDYDFELDQVLIQAGVNAWSYAGANSGFAAWPVHGEQWTVAIPPGDLAPANADVDPLSISDIIVRVRHRANTVGPAGSGVFTPSCGG